MNYIIVSCPSCKNLIQIFKKDFNCKIFRHGVYKNTLKNIDPHANKEFINKLLKQKNIIGCGIPFILKIKDKKYYTEICDYI